MKILRISEEDGYLDQALIDGWVRIQVVKATQYPLTDDQYFKREPNIRLLLAYLREIGLSAVLRKVSSRRAEGVRNERYIVLGIGRVIERRAPNIALNSLVAFIVPDSGPLSERYVIRADLVGDVWPGSPGHPIDAWRVVKANTFGDDSEIAGIAGWNAYSGAPWLLSRSEIASMVGRALNATGNSITCRYGQAPITERENMAQESGVTIFGYGNYVKTMIIPQLRSKIPIQCVHEIDPWQIGRRRNESWTWDTSPCLRPDEFPDVVVVASYHHTHSDLAVSAIKRGARAVIIEKPLVTNRTDLRILCDAIAEHGTAVFGAFQRRYSPFNEPLLVDLGIQQGDAISCFVSAYEVPLPPRHWYRWPNSGSRIISNGCHWIDHFLYLNSYSQVRELKADHLGGSAVVVRISLENDATLLLSLTHAGSPRLGVRDHCEFRANGVTATITDSKHYVSESSRGIIRRLERHRFAAYRRMYRSISKTIIAGTAGDSLYSVWQSSNTMLAAEAALLDVKDVPLTKYDEVEASRTDKSFGLTS